MSSAPPESDAASQPEPSDHSPRPDPTAHTGTARDRTRGAAVGHTPPRRMRWGIRDAVVAIVLLGVVVFLTVVVARAIPNPDLDLVSFVGSVLGYGVVFGIVVLASHGRGLGSLRRDFGLRFRWVDLPIGVAVAVVAKLVLVVAGSIAEGSGLPLPTQGNLTLSDSGLWIVLNGILVASLIAPFVEELLFRGLLMRAIRNKVLRWRGRPQPASAAVQRGAIVTSILVSALVFAALHAYEATDVSLLVFLTLGTLVVGILNGIAATVTGRLGAGIVAHVLYNGSSVVLLLLAAKH